MHLNANEKIFIYWSDGDDHGYELEEYDSKEEAEKRLAELKKLETTPGSDVDVIAVLKGVRVKWEAVEVITKVKLLGEL